MPYVVTEDCIKCKYMDCVEICPVSCFYEGDNMLVIHPDECIDCAACEPTCPVDAIVSDDTVTGSKWIDVNRKYSAIWPKIAEKAPPPDDAKQWEKIPNKFATHFSAAAGSCHLDNIRPGRNARSRSQDRGGNADSDFT
jgi:ferredoxin